MTAWPCLRLPKRSCRTGAVLDRVYNCGVRLVSIHTRLVGSIDAIILFTLAAMNVVMMAALLDPALASFEALGKRGTVTIEQIA
jgi:hypothetical protein